MTGLCEGNVTALPGPNAFIELRNVTLLFQDRAILVAPHQCDPMPGC